MKTLIVLVIATALIISFRIIVIAIKKISAKYKKWKKAIHFIIAAEFIVWVVYSFWIIDFLFKGKSYYPYLNISLIIIIVGLLSWFLIKDFVVGIIFKVENDFRLNQNIKINDLSGKIIEMGFSHVKIETKAGEIARIPYAKLRNEIITEYDHTSSSDHSKFKLITKKSYTKNEWIDQIKRTILSSPWSSFKKSPVIICSSENDENYTFEIVIYSLVQKHAIYLENYLRKRFKDL